jgi:hypothetical protein
MSRLVYANPALALGTATPTNLLAGVALNAVAASRTVTIELQRQFEQIVAVADLTWGSATTLTITPTLSRDGTNYDPEPVYTASSGTLTMNNLVWSKTVSADDQLVGKLDVSGVENLRLLVGGSAVTDTFNLRVMLIGRK